MPVSITAANISLLAPSARSSYRDGFAQAQPVLDAFGISQSPLRLAHFMAQVLHESGGLTLQFENLNYSAPRLPVVWPSRFLPDGPLDPNAYAHNPEKLADEVYGHRMGNTAAGDGFKYRGRGLIQITGKDEYAAVTATIRTNLRASGVPDFVAAPDEVISAAWCVAAAAAVWDEKQCNPMADDDSIRRVTRAINGGLTGLAQREDWLRKTRAIWH
jgi:putative chitinase